MEIKSMERKKTFRIIGRLAMSAHREGGASTAQLGAYQQIRHLGPRPRHGRSRPDRFWWLFGLRSGLIGLMGSAFGRVGAVIGVFALASGCSGATGGGPSLPLGQFSSEFLAARCHKLLTCCSAELAAIDPMIVDQAS